MLGKWDELDQYSTCENSSFINHLSRCISSLCNSQLNVIPQLHSQSQLLKKALLTEMRDSNKNDRVISCLSFSDKLHFLKKIGLTLYDLELGSENQSQFLLFIGLVDEIYSTACIKENQGINWDIQFLFDKILLTQKRYLVILHSYILILILGLLTII